MGSTNEIVKNFFNELAANNRLSVLASVSEKFAQLMSAHRGEVELIVTSAAVSQYWGEDISAPRILELYSGVVN